MIKRIPIIPTIIVVATAAIMVALGIWQLGRAEEKAELIVRYEAASGNAEEVAYPYDTDGEQSWFRRSRIYCGDVRKFERVAGTSARGEKGWVIRAICHDYFAESSPKVDLGFSREFDAEPAIDQMLIEGVIAPGPRLIADPALPSLQPLAKPDPKDLPNNHLAYAGQWFFFALTALVIYGFALKSRASKRD